MITFKLIEGSVPTSLRVETTNGLIAIITNIHDDPIFRPAHVGGTYPFEFIEEVIKEARDYVTTKMS